MNCIIIDDDEVSCRVIEDYINRTSFLDLQKSFTNAIDAINYLKAGADTDLIFLDIEMPEMTGFEFLNTIANPPQVIIITSREKHALEAFDYSVVDFLLKPVSYARFYKAANKASESQYKTQENRLNEIFIKKSNSLIKIKYDEILWIEALENYVVINTHDEKYTIHFTMKSIEGQLPNQQFKRVHRSFIVNVLAISSIEDNSILIKIPEGKKSIPIGKSYRDKLLNEINLMNK